MKNTTQKGKEAESLACEFLKENDFVIIDRNFYTKFGEIDIIAKKDSTLHFIEVKSGIGFEPVFNITKTKLDKIIKSINIYIKTKNTKDPFCIDGITIYKENENSQATINLLENLTIY
ncbi:MULTISPECIES: YraN family protein [Helicobacter]|uniref:UPF0102 protein PF021_05915 n=1 Tax=Helicobacter ibis TaxID=2962633 RepID=A0ABT4VER6_9HELI|nr:MULTISPECIES: YraN family protein [Helicobacter]MDA3967078.1 YraN family protein [Helicobacter sp. WB40]MDA3969212.1 YraN family protein [Helicobacter ibis]